MKVLSLILLFIPTMLFADTLVQPKIEAPKAKVMDKPFIATLAVLAAAKATDGFTSARMLNRGCVEMNTVFGSHPSSERIAGTNAAYFAGEAVIAYALKRLGSNHRWSHRLWLIDPAFQVTEHIHLAARNEGLSCVAPITPLAPLPRYRGTPGAH